MAYEVLDSKPIYAGRVFSIRQDRLRLPDGRESRLDIVDHSGSVVILPLDEAGNLIFVRQYRHPAGAELLELPAGMLDPGESPLECARREVREETGLAAGRMVPLGSFFLAPGYSTERMHVYLASELRPDPLEADSDEFIQLERIPLEQVLLRARSGELCDAKSLAALFLAGPMLKER
jgi:ADP-ribose pyrophosphatase